MAAEFGLGGYEPGQLKEIFDLFPRAAAGGPATFVPGEPAQNLGAQNLGAPNIGTQDLGGPDPREPCSPGRPGPLGAVEPGRLPGLPAVEGEPDRGRADGSAGRRDALVIGGHADVGGNPSAGAAPLEVRRPPAGLTRRAAGRCPGRWASITLLGRAGGQPRRTTPAAGAVGRLLPARPAVFFSSSR